MKTKTRKFRGDLLTVVPDVICQQIRIVNCYFVGHPGSEDWILVDAGMGRSSARRIREAAEQLYGPGARPKCIVLTHGHFDHVGALPELADEWDVPVFAHQMEMPYLTGLSAYPPFDPVAGGGAMSRMSPLFPRGPFDLGDRVAPLPLDHRVPGTVGWRWIHTPGHSPGHVALFRDADGTLLAGDAFVTTRIESLFSSMLQIPELGGPPRFLTMDWQEARRSVELLASLRPNVAACGHGLPMSGPELRRDLDRLALEFSKRAVPRRGRYVRKPVIADSTGVVHVPRPVMDPLLVAVGGIALGALAGTVLSRRRSRQEPLVTAYVPRETVQEPLLESSLTTVEDPSREPVRLTGIPVDESMPASAYDPAPLPGLMPPSAAEAPITPESRILQDTARLDDPVPGLLPRTPSDDGPSLSDRL